MTTSQIFELADGCISVGCFPQLAEKHFILGLQIKGTGTARIHRKEVSFQLYHPCRVWLMSGRFRVLLGDSDALPLDLSEGVRPPFTL